MAVVQSIDTGTDHLLCTIQDRVAVLTLNRPEARNALSPELSAALARLVAAFADDAAVGALLLTGAGTAFCSGGDVKKMGAANTQAAASHDARFRALRARHRGTAGAIYALRKPTVVALPGAAAGAGLALALACDLRIAARSAMMTTGYTNIALSGDYGIAWLLTRAIGPGRARELMLTGARIDAQRAETIGLVHRLVDDAQLQAEALTLATSLANGPATAYEYIKDNLDEALQIGHLEAIDHEAERLMRTQDTADHREAVRAFVEKRRPIFGQG